MNDKCLTVSLENCNGIKRAEGGFRKVGEILFKQSDLKYMNVVQENACNSEMCIALMETARDWVSQLVVLKAREPAENV